MRIIIMGLFDAKYCAICGSKVGLLGTMKLDDGHLCKDCTAKLSPYFSRRHQNLASVQKHLAYREQNRINLQNFSETAVYGTTQKIHLDENHRTLVISRSSDLIKANADLISFDDVQSLNKEIREDRDELKQEGEDGKKVSYDPPRYEYEYSFLVKMKFANENINSSVSVDISDGDHPEIEFGEDYLKYNYLANELINTIAPGTIDEVIETPAAEPLQTAEPVKFYKMIRCTNCGWTSDGPDIPNFCPNCADPITLDDIAVIDVSSILE